MQKFPETAAAGPLRFGYGMQRGDFNRLVARGQGCFGKWVALDPKSIEVHACLLHSHPRAASNASRLWPDCWFSRWVLRRCI